LGRGASFNLATGTVGQTQAGVTATIQAAGNGWYRCAITAAATTTASEVVFFSSQNADSATTVGFAGDGYSGIYIWGAQLEAGAFPTSYIPTVASQVTRAADAASITGANFTGFYNAGESTIYAEAATVEPSGQTAGILGLHDGTSLNTLQLFFGTASNRFEVVTNNVTQANISMTRSAVNTFTKFAGAAKVNDFMLANNGTLGTADTSGIISTGISTLQIGGINAVTGTNLNGHLRKLSYYPQRLSNANLVALTS
jgi:hypothetical protein